MSSHGLSGVYMYSVLNLIKMNLHGMDSEATMNPGGTNSESLNITPAKTSFSNSHIHRVKTETYLLVANMPPTLPVISPFSIILPVLGSKIVQTPPPSLF